ncbi:MAG: pitrilysin family protein [Proteobacteria bacterium]|nr:pitrilysin family protein [Pseudomonadota bacterium]
MPALRLPSFVLFALVAAWTVISPVRAAVFNPETFTLDNGLQVVVIPNHRVPVVTHMIWFRVGSADEPAAQTGIAHFLEHLMFKGTPSFPAGEFSATVARIGGQENAFTSYDFTAYYQTVALDRLERVMAMEADRMNNLVLSEEDVRTEREVILEERRMRVDNDPASRLHEQASAVQFLNHPYRLPVIGWEHDIRKLSREQALAFYQAYYAPNNAILVVGGDITAAELKPLAEKYYGALPREPDIVRTWTDEPPQLAARSIAMRDARVRQPSWGRDYVAPSYIWGDTRQAFALQVLAEILGGTENSRLYRRLVVEEKLAVRAGAAYSPTSRGPSTFDFYASPRDGHDLERMQAEIEREIAALLSDGVTENEVDKAKARLRAQAIYARDSLTTGANVLGRAIAIGQSVDDVEAWPERIAAVTATEVVQAARAVLVNERSVSTFLYPAKEQAFETSSPR